MRTHRILVEFVVEDHNKSAAEAHLRTNILHNAHSSDPNNHVKEVTILYVSSCKKDSVKV